MKNYFYKNGQEVKVGDICFYSESAGDSEFHYGNSILEIVEYENELSSIITHFTQNDGMSFITNTDHWPISLEHMSNKEGVLTDCIYIGWGNSAYSDKEQLDFYNKEYRRRGQIKKINKLIKKELR